jgi:uncharacterized membrane protein (UPF0127 family)
MEKQRFVSIKNIDNPLLSPLQVVYCASFFCRLRGLTFRRSLGSGDGLLLVQGRESRLDASIHMIGVFIDLGVIWLNQDNVVVDARLARRWRWIYLPKSPAQYVLEVSVERLDEFRIGDRLRFEDL